MTTLRLASLALLLSGACLATACSPPTSQGMDATAGSDAASDAVTPGPDAPAPEMLTVNAPQGPVLGTVRNGVARFLKLPYAAPPVGGLRWKPPQAAPTWATPRDGDTLGPGCVQSSSPLFGWTGPTSEDCLHANVWSPRAALAPGATRRPVMLFIHGGGYSIGSGGSNQYDGAQLAARGDVVVVTINYRLGALGFLAVDELVAEDAHGSAGNYGMLDQIAALRWVQDQIAAYGGDPNNVTIFGESAGSMSVCALAATPLARGLFARAIEQSGICAFFKTPLHDTAPVNGRTYESAIALGNRFAASMSCPVGADRLACLRSKTPAQILAGLQTPFELTVATARFQPNIDGYVLPRDPWTMIREGEFARVPYLIGTNADEGSVFVTLTNVNSQATYESAVRAVLPAHATEILAAYAPGTTEFPNVQAAYSAFIADAVFTCPSRQMARIVTGATSNPAPAWLYRFTKVNVGTASLGVFHGAELPYVFGNFVGLFRRGPGDDAVADTLMGFWSRFAQTGNPAPAGSTLWPTFTTAGDAYLEIGETTRSSTGLRRDACDRVDGWLMDL